VAAQSTWRALWFPEGTYTFSQQVNWLQKKLYGAGMGRTIFQCSTPLTFACTALAGSLIVQFHGGAGGNTAPLSPSALQGPQALQAFLQAIPAVGANNVQVTQPLYGGNMAYMVFRIEWTAGLGNQAITPLTVQSTLTCALGACRAWVDYGMKGDGTHNQVEYLYVANPQDIAAFAVSGDSRLPQHEGYSLNGPGTPLLGVRTGGVDGLLVQGQPSFRDVSVGGMDSGFRVNSATGHVSLVGCLSRGNFDGLGITMTGNDFFCQDCFFDNNNRASVSVKTPTTGGLLGAKFSRCHGGFSPFGIFQEIGGAATSFISECELDTFIMEAIGNGAIYSQIASGKAGPIGQMRIYHPGFYWDAPHRVNWYPWDYAVEAQYTDGYIEIDGGVLPFADGQVNTYHFAAMGSSGGSAVICRSNNPEDATVDDTFNGRFRLLRNNATYTGTGNIASGQTSLVVTLPRVQPGNTEGFRGNPASMALVAVPNDPANYGGLAATAACTLLCSGYTTNKAGDTTFTITYKGPALTANLSVSWRLRGEMH
jgi:hypothetical protein